MTQPKKIWRILFLLAVGTATACGLSPNPDIPSIGDDSDDGFGGSSGDGDSSGTGGSVGMGGATPNDNETSLGGEAGAPGDQTGSPGGY